MYVCMYLGYLPLTIVQNPADTYTNIRTQSMSFFKKSRSTFLRNSRTEYSTIPTVGCKVVKGKYPTLGVAFDNDRKREDLPAYTDISLHKYLNSFEFDCVFLKPKKVLLH